MDKPASSDTENEASRETEIGLLAEAFCERPLVRRRLCQDAETSCARLKARRRAWWARTWPVMSPWLTF